uniref:hypothetical protein n=1 Tax=Flavobacterium sp. TaxID=239 RepID=UPI00404ADA88
MKKLIFVLSFFYSIITHAQILNREVLRGHIQADSIAVENVTIFNKTSNKGAISDVLGFFSIYAKPSDTLVFSNVAFSSRALVLNEFDFKIKVVSVQLKTKINELDEIIITPYSLTGDLIKDDKNLKITNVDQDMNVRQIVMSEVNPDFYTTSQNIAMPNDGTIKYGFDFVKVGKLLKNSVFGNKSEKNTKFNSAKYYQDKIVPEIIKEKFSYSFFHETLNLKNDEIGLFLSFCENDPEIQSLLTSEEEIYLIDFLIKKNQEFKNLNK